MTAVYIALSVAGVLIVFAAGAYFFFNQSKFGKLPQGERLHRIGLSPNWFNGHFRNQIATPMLAGGMSRRKVYLHFLFGKKERPKPPRPLPSVRVALSETAAEREFLIWLGHSSYYLQLGGLRFLVDPVFSPSASPFSFVTRAFEGTNPYLADDFPKIDCLLITHDHWDHLNKPTLLALKGRIGQILCPLGVGGHLEHWGFDRSVLLEGDWYERFVLGGGKAEAYILPARHFSGRSLWGNNKSLWASFAVCAGGRRVYFGGDSGYGPHYKEIGESLGPFDLVALENGQYNEAWPNVHMQPEESWQAACDLRAKTYIPGHSAKFVISNHSWDEPLERIWEIGMNAETEIGEGAQGLPRLVTPQIGGVVDLNAENLVFSPWWREVH